MAYITLLRKKEHEELAKLKLIGKILDLGGSKKSDYFKIISRQTSSITVINVDKSAEPDVVGNIEKNIDAPSAYFDAVVAMNILEHVFDYRRVIEESVRVLKNGGLFVATVPFLFTIHPSPEDYFRYTKSSLIKIFSQSGLVDVSVKELGCGIMVARYQLIQNFLPNITRPLFELAALFLDTLLLRLALILGRKYKPEYFPLGYIATGRKV